MSNEDYILKLVDRKAELIKICNYHGVYQVDDILQELYVKLLLFKDIDKYVKNSSVNMFIIFAIIRNIIYDYRKSENRFTELDFDIEQDEPIENDKYDFIIRELDGIEYWFDRTLLQLYINNDHTIRSLSRETRIGTHVIQKVFRKFKVECVEKYEKSKLGL